MGLEEHGIHFLGTSFLLNLGKSTRDKIDANWDNIADMGDTLASKVMAETNSAETYLATAPPKALISGDVQAMNVGGFEFLERMKYFLRVDDEWRQRLEKFLELSDDLVSAMKKVSGMEVSEGDGVDVEEE